MQIISYSCDTLYSDDTYAEKQTAIACWPIRLEMPLNQSFGPPGS